MLFVLLIYYYYYNYLLLLLEIKYDLEHYQNQLI